MTERVSGAATPPVLATSDTQLQTNNASPTVFTGLREFAIAELDRAKADLESISEPELTMDFHVDGRHMVEDDIEVTTLLEAISSAIPRGSTTVYCISPHDAGDAAEVIRDFFLETKRKRDGRSRDNKRLSTVLYVGSSRKMATRMREHLGFCSRSTYALKLSEWYPAAELPLRLTCAVYPPETSATVTAALEDALWERLCPMFGRKGAR